MAISNFSQFANTSKGYHLTPKDPTETDAAILGNVTWSTNRSDLVAFAPSGAGLDVIITLSPYNGPGSVEAYASAVNALGVSFTHTLAIAMPVPPPPAPAADHFAIVQDA